jgi:hypothetical protein
MEDGTVWPIRKIAEQPIVRKRELLDSALAVVAMELKDALWGIAPLRPDGREHVLALCLKIIDED